MKVLNALEIFIIFFIQIIFIYYIIIKLLLYYIGEFFFIRYFVGNVCV